MVGVEQFSPVSKTYFRESGHNSLTAAFKQTRVLGW